MHNGHCQFNTISGACSYCLLCSIYQQQLLVKRATGFADDVVFFKTLEQWTTSNKVL